MPLPRPRCKSDSSGLFALSLASLTDGPLHHLEANKTRNINAVELPGPKKPSPAVLIGQRWHAVRSA
jgi:hypothetical protein